MNTAAALAPGLVWQSLRDAASAPYRSAGRFAWRFAHGKLGLDPVFRHLLSHGLIAPRAQVLDIGCGQGLLTSLLRAADAAAARGHWPAAWAPAPHGARVTGIELMSRDVERAQRALGDAAAEFVCGDMRHTPFPACDVAVILDVLHYIDIGEQNRVLERVRAALRPGSRLLLRVGDASSRRGFRTSQWVDAIVTFVRGHRVLPVFGRSLAAWIVKLEALGFRVDAVPMSRGTPFANVLLIAEVTA
jgi:SAM-dependent methyltransferase